MLAEEQLRVLSARIPDLGLDVAVEELARIAQEGNWEIGPGDPDFDATVAEVTQNRSMLADLTRAWSLLQQRIVEARVRTRMDAVRDRIFLGTAGDGEVSAAVFAYPDDSFLVLVDHGLMLCTWLIAQLAAILATDDPGQTSDGAEVRPDDAAAVARLAIARPAVGARAGLLPALTLPRAQFHLAAALCREMDVFLLAHEVAHVLLGHFRTHRRGLAAIAGSCVMADNTRADEHAADLVALTLMLDDIDQGRTDPRHAPLRLAAVRLTLALIEAYERACFVIQPASHPPGAQRFSYLHTNAFKQWFGSQADAALRPIAPLAKLLEQTPSEDLVHALGRFDRGLDRFIDRPLWRASDWADLAQLASFVLPVRRTARRALNAWFPDNEAGDERLAAMLTDLAADPATQALIHDSEAGLPLTRLRLLEHTNALLITRDSSPYPAWAVGGLLAEALRETKRG